MKRRKEERNPWLARDSLYRDLYGEVWGFHPFNNCGNLFFFSLRRSCNVLLLEMVP